VASDPFGQAEPPEFPFEDGPYLWVAVPEPLESFIPMNVTRFIEEWVEMLDPVEALHPVPVLQYIRRFNWHISKHYTTTNYAATWVLREARRDDSVVDAFADTTRDLLREGDDEGVSLGNLKREGALTNGAQPVLLGLGVIATAKAQMGMAGTWLAERLKSYEQSELDKAEEKVSAEAAKLRDELDDFEPERWA
jgi:hypothetical protein